MNEDATITPAIPAPPAPPPVMVAERAEPILGSLALARGITLRHLQRIDSVAEAMAAEELKVALAEDGQMTLNLTRADRALRQICAMELEIMGLREPPAPRGPASETRGPNSNGGGRTGRHDRNDLNDLNDLRDIEDLEALDALYDFDDPVDQGHYDDLDALEQYKTHEEYYYNRPHTVALTTEQTEALDRRIGEELDKIDWSKLPEPSDEERYYQIQTLNAELKADVDAETAKEEAIWSQRRAALLKLRATQKRMRKKSRGPPGG